MSRGASKAPDGSGEEPGKVAGPSFGPGIGELVGLGIAAAVLVAVGVGGGYWIGQVTGGGVTITFIGLGAGILLALLTMYLRIRRYL